MNMCEIRRSEWWNWCCHFCDLVCDAQTLGLISLFEKWGWSRNLSDLSSVKCVIFFETMANCAEVKRQQGVSELEGIMLPCLLSRFSRVRLCATPQTAAHRAPASLGFSRQEHWSGLPFPSPMYESEKWKWSHSVMSDSLRLHGLQPTKLLRPWDFPGKSTGVGCHCLLREGIIESCY